MTLNNAIEGTITFKKFMKPASKLMAMGAVNYTGNPEIVTRDVAKFMQIGSRLTKGQYITQGVILGIAIVYVATKVTKAKDEVKDTVTFKQEPTF